MVKTSKMAFVKAKIKAKSSSSSDDSISSQELSSKNNRVETIKSTKHLQNIANKNNDILGSESKVTETPGKKHIENISSKKGSKKTSTPLNSLKNTPSKTNSPNISNIIAAANLSTKKDLLKKILVDSNKTVELMKQKNNPKTSITTRKSILKNTKSQESSKDIDSDDSHKKILPLSQGKYMKMKYLNRTKSSSEDSFSKAVTSTQIKTSQNSSDDSDSEHNSSILKKNEITIKSKLENSTKNVSFSSKPVKRSSSNSESNTKNKNTNNNESYSEVTDSDNCDTKMLIQKLRGNEKDDSSSDSDSDDVNNVSVVARKSNSSIMNTSKTAIQSTIQSTSESSDDDMSIGKIKKPQYRSSDDSDSNNIQNVSLFTKKSENTLKIPNNSLNLSKVSLKTPAFTKSSSSDGTENEFDNKNEFLNTKNATVNNKDVNKRQKNMSKSEIPSKLKYNKIAESNKDELENKDKTIVTTKQQIEKSSDENQNETDSSKSQRNRNNDSQTSNSDSESIKIKDTSNIESNKGFAQKSRTSIRNKPLELKKRNSKSYSQQSDNSSDKSDTENNKDKSKSIVHKSVEQIKKLNTSFSNSFDNENSSETDSDELNKMNKSIDKFNKKKGKVSVSSSDDSLNVSQNLKVHHKISNKSQKKQNRITKYVEMENKNSSDETSDISDGEKGKISKASSSDDSDNKKQNLDKRNTKISESRSLRIESKRKQSQTKIEVKNENSSDETSDISDGEKGKISKASSSDDSDNKRQNLDKRITKISESRSLRRESKAKQSQTKIDVKNENSSDESVVSSRSASSEDSVNRRQKMLKQNKKPNQNQSSSNESQIKRNHYNELKNEINSDNDFQEKKLTPKKNVALKKSIPKIKTKKHESISSNSESEMDIKIHENKFKIDNTNLQEYLDSNSLLESINFVTKYKLDDLINHSSDEIWVAQCPKEINPELLNGITLKSDGSKIKVDSKKYEYNFERKKSKICFISSNSNKNKILVAKILPSKGKITIFEDLKEKSVSDIKELEKSTEQLPNLNSLKVRHPLFGSNFEDNIKITEEIKRKLIDAEINRRKLELKTEKKKKIKPLDKNKSEKNEMIFQLLNQSKNKIQMEEKLSRKRKRSENESFEEINVKKHKKHKKNKIEVGLAEGYDIKRKDKEKSNNKNDFLPEDDSSNIDNTILKLKEEAMSPNKKHVKSKISGNIVSENIDTHVQNVHANKRSKKSSICVDEMPSKKKQKKSGVTQEDEPSKKHKKYQINENIFSYKDEIISPKKKSKKSKSGEINDLKTEIISMKEKKKKHKES